MPDNAHNQKKDSTPNGGKSTKQQRREARRAKVAAYHQEKARQERRRKITMAVSAVAAFVLVIGGVVAIAAVNSARDASAEGSVVLREDDRRLQTAEDGKVTLVEFLDLECEACGALFPIVEQVREKYADKVTFAVRYFPTHANSEAAAAAAEAAGEQGKFEEMYTTMFENQREWAEQQTPQDDVFRGYAEELGLDMAEFDEDFDSKEIRDRIEQDREDGLKAGVQGTPTFFLNGEKVETPADVAGFSALLDEALAA